MGKSWGATKAPTKSSNKTIEDVVDVFKFSAEYSAIRFIGPITSVGTHWINIEKKDGKVIPIPKVCLNYNPDTEDFDENNCPYCEEGARFGTRYYANGIVRELQEAEPRKKYPPIASEKKKTNIGTDDDPHECLVKDKSSKTWTPVRIIALPTTLAASLVNIAQTNRHIVGKKGKRQEKEFDIADPKYGCDIDINLQKGGAHGYGKYDLQKSVHSPLTKTERGYHLYTLDLAEPESLKDAKKNMKELKKILADEDDTDNDEKPKKRNRKSGVEDPYDKDDDPEYIEKTSRKKRKKKKNKDSEAFDNLDKDLERISKKKDKGKSKDNDKGKKKKKKKK